MDEFDIIRRLFAPLARAPGADGLRDDAAEIDLPDAGRLIATTDAIVEGVHFLTEDPIETVARKLVRVNVSDVLAKGAAPDAALLTLVWPEGRPVSELERFAAAFGEECDLWGVKLAGGDTTRTAGPMVLSLTLCGVCGDRGPVRRSGARPGDDVWVTGEIGDGWLGLQAARGSLAGVSEADARALADRYRTPQPPSRCVAEVVARFASASVDVSDGMIADAGHVAAASGVGIVLLAPEVPLSAPARAWAAAAGAEAEARLVQLVTGGDDYQTLFCAPRQARDAVAAVADAGGVKLRRIGSVTAGEGVEFQRADGGRIEIGAGAGGWRHRWS